MEINLIGYEKKNYFIYSNKIELIIEFNYMF